MDARLRVPQLDLLLLPVDVAAVRQVYHHFDIVVDPPFAVSLHFHKELLLAISLSRGQAAQCAIGGLSERLRALVLLCFQRRGEQPTVGAELFLDLILILLDLLIECEAQLHD